MSLDVTYSGSLVNSDVVNVNLDDSSVHASHLSAIARLRHVVVSVSLQEGLFE